MLRQLLSSVFLSTAALSAAVIVTNQAADFSGRPVRQSFDSILDGSDISGQTIDGIHFIAPFAPLHVVTASSTFTPGGFAGTTNTALNTLPATSGLNVLSPGGPVLAPGSNPGVEADWMTLEFQAPVTFFGFDLLHQSADSASYAFIRVLDSNSNVLYSGKVGTLDLGGAGAPGGAEFWGISATGGTAISRVEIQELDDDARFPDSNIGVDSLRYGSEAPEPGTVAMLGVGLALMAVGTKRR
jgi:hypothetical protein